jgi:hypothetical protein
MIVHWVPMIGGLIAIGLCLFVMSSIKAVRDELRKPEELDRAKAKTDAAFDLLLQDLDRFRAEAEGQIQLMRAELEEIKVLAKAESSKTTAGNNAQ